MAMRPCLISEWRSQPIVASWPTCVVSRGDGAAAATITRTPQTHAAVGVALHAQSEGHVRETQGVVEAGRARDRVLEVDEVRLGVGEDRLGRGRRRRRDEGRRHGGERERDDELHGNLRAERRRVGGLSTARRASMCALAASSLRPALAASAPWRGCSMRTQSYASQLAAVEAGTSCGGQRSTVDRRRARGSRFFLHQMPARRCVLASAMPPRILTARLALFYAVRRLAEAANLARDSPHASAGAAFAAPLQRPNQPSDSSLSRGFRRSLTTMELPCPLWQM